MLKPTQNFVMSKQTKRILATILDADSRNAFKANMIQAQLQSEIKPAKEQKSK